MSTEIAIRGGALAVAVDQTGWTEQQLAVLRSVGVSEEVTPAELDQFLHECQRTGLDPFSRQIYLIGRYDKQAGREVFRSQTGIDGYRVVAHRAAKRDHVTVAYSETLWCGPDKVWCDAWLEDWPPRAAKITVLRGGEPFPAVATLGEYAATYKNGDPTPMWRKMPATMLAKCAEAKALRMAFPHDLAGIYTAEEMEQADNSRRESPTVRHRAPVQGEYAEVVEERPADRHHGQIDDEWNTATGQPLPPPAPGMPGVTGEQITEIVRLLGVKRGVYNGRCAGVVSELVRRRIEDPQALSQAEARSIVETLAAEQDLVPLPETATAPAGVPVPPVPGIAPAQMRMMQALLKRQGHTRDGGHALMSRVTGREITSANQLTSTEASAVIHALNTGEVPASPEPGPGPDSMGEGISEFDALDQMILDVASDQARAEVEQAITVEVGRGTITASDAGLLRERLHAHVEQAKAGASA